VACYNFGQLSAGLINTDFLDAESNDVNVTNAFRPAACILIDSSWHPYNNFNQFPEYALIAPQKVASIRVRNHP